MGKNLKAISLLMVILTLIAKEAKCCPSAHRDREDRFTVADESLRGYYGSSRASRSSAWTYEAQDQWANENNQCGLSRQSPVDISTVHTNINKAPSCLQWMGYTRQPEIRFVNSGHTVNVDSPWRNGVAPHIKGGPLPTTYQLAHIHWHWGPDSTKGSEHTINGKTFAMEMHLVHFSTAYPNLTEAVRSNQSDALAVVGVLYKAADSNPNQGISEIVDELQYFIEKGSPPPGADLPLDRLGVGFHNQYFTYLGSLTTPDCNQVVRWIVYKKILQITPKQIDVFRSLTGSDGKPILSNYRETQKKNGRTIYDHAKC